MEGCGKPPKSHDDLLVVVLGVVEGRGEWKATNKSRGLIGGIFWLETMVEGHQRVAMTHWWSFRARLRAEEDGRPPMSLDDSSVVFFDEGQGRREVGSHQ